MYTLGVSAGSESAFGVANYIHKHSDITVKGVMSLNGLPWSTKTLSFMSGEHAGGEFMLKLFTHPLVINPTTVYLHVPMMLMLDPESDMRTIGG